MRSKLLSLHLILTILQAHIVLFAARHITIPSSTPGTPRSTFVQATKQYLCLSLSRNAVSPVGQVFELSVEIFWNVMHGLRGRMKKEIEVLLNEIFLPILEMRTSTLRQKSLVLGVCLRLARDPQALVEIYLNYDCDRTALANIYERLVEVVAKLGATQFAPTAGGIGGASANASGSEAGGVGRNEGGRGGPLDKGPIIPPSLTTSAMGGHGASDSIGGGAGAGGALFPGGHPSWASLPPEVQLKRQGLECLVTILRSLVQWGTAAPRGAASAGAGPDQPRPSEDSGAETLIPEPTTPALNGNTNDDDDDELGVAASDDPERFETAKLRKTTLLEGIKKFNLKPKAVRRESLAHTPRKREPDADPRACRRPIGHHIPP
jgi:brefeldin A-inhibited guanine nucleotide-exchange protein